MPENRRVDRSDPVSETWDHQKMMQELAASVREGRTGIADYNRMPEKVVVGGGMLRKLKESREIGVEEDREIGFEVLYNPGRDTIIIPKELVRGTQVEIGDKIAQASVGERNINIGSGLAYNNLSDEDRVRAHNAIMFLRTGRQVSEKDRKLVDSLHTQNCGFSHFHNLRTPFSFGDLANVLADNRSRYAALMQPGGEINLILTSNQTEGIPREEVSEKMNHWKGLLLKRVEELRARGLIDNSSTEDLNWRIQEAMIKTLAKKRKFAYYRGDEQGLERVV